MLEQVDNQKHFINFISVWLVYVMSMILPVIIMLCLGRFYAVEEFGNYSVAASFMGAMAIFLSFGLGNVVSYEIAAIKDKEKPKVSELIISSVVSLFIFSIFGIFLTAVSLYFLNYNAEIVRVAILLGIGYWFIGANSILSGVFMGLKKMHIPAIAAFFVVLAAIALVVPSLYFHCPLWEIALAWALSQGIGCSVTLWYLHKEGLLMRSKIKKEQIKLMLKRSVGIGFDSVISRFGANLTNILLPVYLTAYQIGLFNGAFKPFVLLAFPGECCMRFFSPYIAGIRDSAKENIGEYLSFMHKVVAFFTLTILIIPIFFSTTLIKLVFGEKLIESASYMAVLAFGYMIFYLPPQSPPLMALSLEWKVIWCSIVRFLSNLIAIIVFIPKYGIMGAVIAINISLFGYWIMTIIIYKKAKLRPVKNPFRYIVFAATTFLLGWIMNKWVSKELLGVVLFLVITGLFSLIVYWDKSEKQMAIPHARVVMRKLGFGFLIKA